MIKREVSIVTGWGGHLGTGHVQRMASLAFHINRHTPLKAYLVCERKPGFLPELFDDCIVNAIRPDSAFIIRDKRDSTISDMEALQSHGRVIAIDDCGPGRGQADLAIDLLPNLQYSSYDKDLFIFGFTFADSVMKLGVRTVTKDIDFAVYCGISPPQRTIAAITALIPVKYSYAVLAGATQTLFKDGTAEPLNKSYAEILMSSKVLITHFGITLYEGLISGCKIITINPTEYHSRLSDIAGDGIDLVNLGVIDAIDPSQARSAISGSLTAVGSSAVAPPEINEAIKTGLDLFISRIRPFF
ncbi:MAG TPA: hypothetical protein PLM53_00945 [Spirochaetota bacterium]|nr:hypothetical protein [Spirochaetota bacterium]HPC39411.1 hypothetical protein [Spirochaetota bacterium]HPL17295.1 hypothetical protein [Spirochaetota bacterium]HQF06748.1 hypothetical protein [Spirochaetota bacterium]HQH95633.1 hypothetical protein [Spirochaetota bacterium]